MINEFYLSCRATQAATLQHAIEVCLQQLQANLDNRNLDFSDLCFCRFFCSDVYHQAPLIEKSLPPDVNFQRLYIGQQPLDSAFISLQAYAIKGLRSKTVLANDSLLIKHGGYTSFWTLDYPQHATPANAQTNEILASCQSKLAQFNMDFADNVIRTWYYLRDIDNNYSGMIKSRVERYEQWGLTSDNHFIASTGIEGRSPWPHTLVALHAHAIHGLEAEQITYLKALDNLSPTQLYGVNFERAARVQYGDRCHCHISGTASIDKSGNVLYPGNVYKQAQRTLENIEALLQEGNMNLSDMQSATVYLRDPYTYRQIREIINAAFPRDCAINFTCGAVCRPDWLIEIEGEAVKMQKSRFADFI